MESSATAPTSNTSAPSMFASEGSTDRPRERPSASQEREGSTPSYRVMPSAKVQPKGNVTANNAKRAARAEAALADKTTLQNHALATRNARSSALHHVLLERELQAQAQRSRGLSALAIPEQSVVSTQSTRSTDSRTTDDAECVQQPPTSNAPAQSTVSEIENIPQEIEPSRNRDSVRQLRKEVAHFGEHIKITCTNAIRLIYGTSKRLDSSSSKLQSEVDQLKREVRSLQCTIKGVIEENARLQEIVKNSSRMRDCGLEMFHARVVNAVACFDKESLDDL